MDSRYFRQKSGKLWIILCVAELLHSSILREENIFSLFSEEFRSLPVLKLRSENGAQVLECKTASSFARSPKIGVIDRAARLLPRSILPFHDRAPKLAQKPRFSDFWRRKGLFCSLRKFPPNNLSSDTKSSKSQNNNCKLGQYPC